VSEAEAVEEVHPLDLNDFTEAQLVELEERAKLSAGNEASTNGAD
jgi:hypothetical protein